MDEQARGLAEDLSENWLRAIGRRHSTRTYTGKPVSAEQLGSLREVVSSFTPWTDAGVELIEHATPDLFTGIVGSYGRIKGAPSALVVLVDTDSASAQAHAGYLGEAAVLQATSLGLGTCWVGGGFSESAVSRHVNGLSGRRVVAIIAVGHPAERLSATDRSMKLLANSAKRKPAAELMAEGGRDWPQWALAAVETARTAPSAVNRQPWRFRLDGDDLVISQDKPDGGKHKLCRSLDCGIAMLHAELGARSAGERRWWRDAAGTGLDVATLVAEG